MRHLTNVSKMKKAVIILMLASSVFTMAAQEKKNSYIPEIHGTIRAKYEYETTLGKGRFEIRNARMSLDGKIIPIVRYKAEIDLSDEGQIRMLDAYVRLQPNERLKFTFGQMRVPFSIDAHRSPHLQYFANRSFIAKQVGNVRDVGAAASWTFGSKVPVTLEGGIFNGSGLTNQKHFWTSDYNFSFKTQVCLWNQFNIVLSCQKAKASDVNTYMYDGGMYWDYSRWHIEAEYLRKRYARNAFKPVNAVDAFVAYRLPLRRNNWALSFLGRYDYMSDQSNGSKDDNGLLLVDDPERHRLTGGLTLSMGKGRLQADVRLNYEQYFYKQGVETSISERNKLVLEFVAHF